MRPSQAFSTLNACVVDGTWTLTASDNQYLDAATLNDWSITFNNTEPAPTYAWTPTGQYDQLYYTEPYGELLRPLPAIY